MDMNQYLSMFIDESNDHLQSLNESMMGLEANPEDLSIVQVIFRSAHTLKGMAATMGFEDLASLTHQMENVLDLVRNNKLRMQDFIFDTLFKSIDALESMVEDITGGGAGKADVTEIVSSCRPSYAERFLLPAMLLLKSLLLRPAMPARPRCSWMSSSTQCWSNPFRKAIRCCMWMWRSARTVSSRLCVPTWSSTFWSVQEKS